jgi:hypothetical protein
VTPEFLAWCDKNDVPEEARLSLWITITQSEQTYKMVKGTDVDDDMNQDVQWMVCWMVLYKKIQLIMSKIN